FQAEDGIRDKLVTGVQTCALPILYVPGGLVIIMMLYDRSILYKVARALHRIGIDGPFKRLYDKHHINHFNLSSLRRLVTHQELRSEERRVGKECRGVGWRSDEKNR